MVYDDCIPVTADPAGINNGSAVSGMNRSSIIDAYINTGVIDCRSKYRMDTVAIWRSDWTVAWPAENTAALRIGWRFTTGLRGSLSGSFLLAESFGKVFRIESRVQGSRGIPGDWRNQKAHGGGMVLDWGIHLLDQALRIGEGRKLISVYAELTNVTNEECDDGFRVTLIFEGDLSMYVEVTTSNFIELPRWYILGENGSAVINDWDLNGEIVKVSDWENRDAVPILAGVGLTKTMAPRTDDTIKHYPLPKVDSSWTQFYENVFAALRGEEEQLITHDQQRRLLKLVDAIFESGNENKVVFFDK